MSTTVYVRLLDESVDVWRPAAAEDLGGGRFRLLAIIDEDIGDEPWEFPPGTTVECEPQVLDDGEVLVATRAI
jgi:hypothetical protein